MGKAFSVGTYIYLGSKKDDREGKEFVRYPQFINIETKEILPFYVNNKELSIHVDSLKDMATYNVTCTLSVWQNRINVNFAGAGEVK